MFIPESVTCLLAAAFVDGNGRFLSEELVAVVFFTGSLALIFSAWLMYLISAIVKRRFPAAPLLRNRENWNITKKIRDSRAFNRWLQDEGLQKDATIRRIYLVSRVLRNLGLLQAAAACVLGLLIRFGR